MRRSAVLRNSLDYKASSTSYQFLFYTPTRVIVTLLSASGSRTNLVYLQGKGHPGLIEVTANHPVAIQAIEIPDQLLFHLVPLEWEPVSLAGDDRLGDIDKPRE